MYGSLVFAIFFLIFLWLLIYKLLLLVNTNGTIKGPKPLPIIGNLHQIGKYTNPFEGFTALSKIYGKIYSIHLGSSPCVVVHGYPLIKEVLIRKGEDFGGRPDFHRFNVLFGGDRNNSLALCDWSILQETRRHIARTYCSPRHYSTNYQSMADIADWETNYFVESIKNKRTHVLDLKPIIMATCMNMFTQYMCSMRFDYDCPEYQKIVHYYDIIFWDINQGYAVDYLPWLSPFYFRHMKKLTSMATEVRGFIMKNVIDEHLRKINYDAPPKDFTDALLQNLKTDPILNWEHVLFELEDFLGGSSAIGNLIILTLLCLIKFPNVRKKIEEEIEKVTHGTRNVCMLDKGQMSYTEATVFETLRFVSSPIVPHVATQDTELEGHLIRKGTWVIMNNYELNKDAAYWDDPQEFRPDRFIKDGRVVKPSHFIPFGTGKRTCVGQQLVYGFSFVMTAAIVQHFDVNVTDEEHLNIKAASVALPPNLFSLDIRPKNNNSSLSSNFGKVE